MGFYGDLEDLPLQDILYVISSHGKSGLLTLSTGSHDISLQFHHGAAASVTASDGSMKIGQLLVSHGCVTNEQIEQALGLQAVNPDSARIGDVLIDVGYVTREQIQKAVNSQLEASIFRILVRGGGTASFERAESVEADPITGGIRLESIILNALRLADEWRALQDPDTILVLTDSLIDSHAVNELDDQERKIVMSVLNGDATIDVLALRSGLSAKEFTETLERLVERGFIETRKLGESDDPQPQLAGHSNGETRV